MRALDEQVVDSPTGVGVSPRFRIALPFAYAAVAFAILGGGIWFIERPGTSGMRRSKSAVPEIGSVYSVNVPFYATPLRDDLQYVNVPDSVNDPDLAASMIDAGEAFEMQAGERFTIIDAKVSSDSITHVRIQTAHGPLWALGAIVLARGRCEPLDQEPAQPIASPSATNL